MSSFLTRLIKALGIAMTFSLPCIAQAACPDLFSFGGICLTQTKAEIASRVRLGDNTGGRGCDYYEAMLAYHGREFPVVLGFEKHAPFRLAEYSVVVPESGRVSLLAAFQKRYGPPVRSEPRSELKMWIWQAGDFTAELNVIDRRPGLSYTHRGVQCDDLSN